MDYDYFRIEVEVIILKEVFMNHRVEELLLNGQEFYRLERKSIPSQLFRDAVISCLDDGDEVVNKLKRLGIIAFNPAFFLLGGVGYLLNHSYDDFVGKLDSLMNTDNVLLKRYNYSFINR